MKKFFLLLLAMPGMLMAQRQVSVLITAPDSLDASVKEIFATEFIERISANNDFQAFNGEENASRADLICVADIAAFKTSYYIKARLLDANSNAVQATASVGSSLAEIEDILAAADKLSTKLFGNVAPVGEEYSTIGFSKKDNCDIISIDNTGDVTIVTLKLFATKVVGWMFTPTAYIRDRATGNTYSLLEANGISTTAFEKKPAGIHEFKLTFAKMPYNVTNIDIVEPDGWEWDNIELRNYGKTGYHLFVDETQKKFDEMMKEIELMRQQEAVVGPIVNVVNSYNSYLITITNEQYASAFVIELEEAPGKFKKLGTVEKRSRLTFRVSPSMFGQLKAIQRDGWLISPQVFKFNVPPMRPQDQIMFTIPRP